MLFLQPVEPFIGNGVVYFDGNIVDDHPFRF
jgi:hypothetical protein